MPLLRTTRRRLLAGGTLLALSAAAGGLCGCASRPGREAVQPLGQSSFAQYARETRAWIAARRDFVRSDHADELEWNSPSELRPPAGTALRGGILLIHGLGDSPWSFVDQKRSMAAAGWLVRTVLLPGCGTRPEDMIPAGADDWRRVVAEQAALLRRDLAQILPNQTPDMWLGGFSTGCNLAIEFAAHHDWISGLVLFSPAVAVRTRLAFLAPIAAPFINWLRDPEASMMRGRTPFRYTVVPVPALAAFVDTMRAAKNALEEKPFEKPAVLMMCEHDSVVDTEALLPFCTKRFASAQTRFLWYGNEATAKRLAGSDARLVVRADNLPAERISSFSHMGLLFSPENPEYGRRGASRICRIGGGAPSVEACLRASPDEIHYGAWGDSRGAGVRARLTFNPWFDAQQADILAVMAGGR